MDFKVNEAHLEETLAAIEQVRKWTPRVMSKLENQIRTADDADLLRLNPLHWAHEKTVDDYEAVDLFLHSAKAGLFYMDWNVICPCCGMVMRSFRNLHGLQSQNTCAVCFRTEHATLDDYVQVTFTLSPSIRPLRYHRPDTLSLEDHCFRYQFEPDARFGPTGTMTLADVLQMAQRHFSTFLPGETITVETEVGPGFLHCIDVFGQGSFAFVVDGEPDTETQAVAIRLTENGFELPRPGVQLR